MSDYGCGIGHLFEKPTVKEPIPIVKGTTILPSFEELCKQRLSLQLAVKLCRQKIQEYRYAIEQLDVDIAAARKEQS